MTNQEALLAEYSTLRQEILQRMQMCIQLLAAAGAVASAFAVYGFQAQNSIAFLAAVAILIAALYYGAATAKELIKVGTYISTLIEPMIEGLKWETMLAEMRKRESRTPVSMSYPITIWIAILLCISCTFFAWWFLRDHRIYNLILYSCITLIIGLTLSIVSVYAFQSASKKYQSDCVSKWKKLEEELYPTATTIHKNSL
jgi:drug/metabolite transporter (DMT)-like permease